MYVHISQNAAIDFWFFSFYNASGRIGELRRGRFKMIWEKNPPNYLFNIVSINNAANSFS